MKQSDTLNNLTPTHLISSFILENECFVLSLVSNFQNCAVVFANLRLFRCKINATLAVGKSVIVHLLSPTKFNQGSHNWVYIAWDLQPFTFKTYSCYNLQRKPSKIFKPWINNKFKTHRKRCIYSLYYIYGSSSTKHLKSTNHLSYYDWLTTTENYWKQVSNVFNIQDIIPKKKKP